MRPQLERLEDRCLPNNGLTSAGGIIYQIGLSLPPSGGNPTLLRFTPYAGEAAGMADTAEQYDGKAWHLVSRLDYTLLCQYRRFQPKCRPWLIEVEQLPVPEELEELANDIGMSSGGQLLLESRLVGVGDMPALSHWLRPEPRPDLHVAGQGASEPVEANADGTAAAVDAGSGVSESPER